MPESGWKLIDKTGAEVAIGTEVKTFRGEPVTVTGFEAPHHEASTGRVYVKYAGGSTSGFFPSVCDLQIVRRGIMKATAEAYDGSPKPVVAIELEAERGDTVASLMHRAVNELTNEWLIKGQGKTWTTIIFSVSK